MEGKKIVKFFLKGFFISLIFCFPLLADAKDINIGAPGDNVKILGTNLCFDSDCRSSWAAITGAWNTNGTNVYYNGGNVGIGTSNPIAGLDNNRTEGFRTLGSVMFAGSLYVGSGNRLLMVDNSGNVIATTTSTFVGLPLSSTAGQTLRSNGTSWDASSVLFNNGSNVGIGTTNPQDLLVVSKTVGVNTGEVRFGGANGRTLSAFNNGGLANFDFNAVQTFFNSDFLIAPGKIISTSNGSTDNLNLTTNDVTKGIYINRNVGISTTTPSRKLHVAGDAQLDAVSFGVTPGQSQTLALATVEYVNSKSGGAGGVGTGTSGQTLRHNGTGWVANSTLFNNGTNVGIGTTNPSLKLEVNGSIAINGTATSDAFRINDGAGNLDRVINRDSSGSIVYMGDIENNGDSLSLRAAGADIMRIDSSGNTGIGVTTPNQKLHVLSGNWVQAKFESNSSGYAPASILLEAGESNSRGQGLFMYNNVSDESYFWGTPYSSSNDRVILSYANQAAWDSAVAQNTSALLTILKGGNVGIGTTNPSEKLESRGGTGNSLIYGVLLSNADTTNTGGSMAGLGFAVNNTTVPKAGVLFERTASYGLGNLYFSLNNVADNTTKASKADAKMTILNNGNVGISTTAPTQKLHVAGAAQLDSLSFGVTPGQSQTLALATVEYVNSKSGGAAGVGTGTSGQTLRHNGTGWVANSTFYNNGTNIGIGTTNLTQPLTLALINGQGINLSDRAISGTMYIGRTGSGSFGGNDTNIGFSGTGTNYGDINYNAYGGNHIFSISRTESMRINSSGNIGLGILNPISKLDVNGKSILRGTYFTDNVINYEYNNLFASDRKWTVTTQGFNGTSNLFDARQETTQSCSSLPCSVTIDMGGIQHYWYAFSLAFNWGTTYAGSSNFTIEKFNDPDATGGCDTWTTIENVTGFSGTKYITTSNLDNHICRFRITFNNITGSQARIELGEISGYQFYNPNNGPMVKRLGDIMYGGLNFSGVNNDIFTPGSEHLALISGGNVGVGLTAPTQKLHVAGAAQLDAVSFGVTPGQTQTLALATVEYVNSKSGGAAGVGTGTSGQTLRHNGTGWVSNSTLYNNGTNVGIGTTNPSSKLFIEGNIKTNGVDPYINMRETAFGQDWTFKVSSSDRRFSILGDDMATEPFMISQVGNIGIGLTLPEAKLHVFGAAASFPSASGTNQTGLMTRFQNNGSNLVMDMGGNSASGGWIQMTNRTDLSASYPLLLNPNGGNVGIGTTNPGATLDVVGNYYLRNSAGGVGTGYGVEFSTSSNLPRMDLVNNGAYVAQFSANATDFLVKNTLAGTGNIDFQTKPVASYISRLYIQNSGNVGIGLTAPTQKLQVAGAAQLDAVSFGVTPGQSQTLALATVEYVNSKSGGAAGVGTGTSGQTLRHNGTGWVANSALFNNGANVGVGTTNPGMKFHINNSSGSGLVDTFLITGGSPAANGTGPNIVFNSDYLAYPTWRQAEIGSAWDSSRNYGGYLVFKTNGSGAPASTTERMRIDKDGNVGIGTTNPQAKLHVNSGNFTLSGGDLYLASLAGETQTQIKSYSGASTLWVIQPNNSVNFVLGTSHDWDRQISLNYTPGTTGSLNGNLQIGQLSKNNAAFTHGITSFYTGGLERMRIDAGGNVGVGHANPGTKLTIGNGATLSAGNNDFISLRAGGVGYVDTSRSLISWSQDNSNIILARFGTEYNAAAGSINFVWRDVYNSAVGSTELMRLTGGGNLGIGSTAPSRKFHVSGDAQLDAVSFGVTPGQAQTLALATVEYVNAKSGGAGGVGAGTTGQTLRHNGTGWIADSGLYNNGTNIGVGTTNPQDKLHILGNVRISGTLNTQTGSDFAEEFTVTKDIEPGTVVVMDDNGYKSVRPSSKAYDRSVIGVVSNNPSIIAGKVDSEKKVIVAMVGVVDVKVVNTNGNIKKGDLLTSANVYGSAMKSLNPSVGTIIGKALEDMNEKSGYVKALINLQ